MTKYFQKITGPKFVGLIILWIIVNSILGIFLAVITPQYALPLTGVVGYFILYFIFKIFGLNPIDTRDIITEPKEKTEKKIILSIIPFLLGGLTSALYVLFLKAFIPSLYESYIDKNQLLQGMNFREFPVEVALLFVSIVILAPIVEEFIFRGVFINVLSKKKSTVFALVVSSLFFGLLHLETMVPTAVIGFALALIYHITGSLRLVIAAHMVNNLIAFVISVSNISISENLTFIGVLGGILFLFYIGGTLYFIRYIFKNKAYFHEETPLFRRSEHIEKIQDYNRPRIIDISFDIESDMSVYPGDPEVKITEVANVVEDGFSVRKIEMNTHAGTHIDFPSHFFMESPGEPDDLSVFYGRVQVLLDFDHEIEDGIHRVIAKNGKLTLERAKELAQEGVILVGVSGDSIEEEGYYEVHKFLLSQRVLIVENLDLFRVIPGLYTLSAFPLRIRGAEAAPARVVLIDDVHRSI